MTIVYLSLIGGPLVILTGDSEPEHCHDISIGEAVRIMRISKEGLRQLHKDGTRICEKLNSLKVNLVCSGGLVRQERDKTRLSTSEPTVCLELVSLCNSLGKYCAINRYLLGYYCVQPTGGGVAYKTPSDKGSSLLRLKGDPPSNRFGALFGKVSVTSGCSNTDLDYHFSVSVSPTLQATDW
ncbi:hypothetical protein BGY98DRAFT_932245 [Russula aff. rugulosa BPL654]|nr:hypothetical protein BGY98DRAFT_932245 [Russula aff. rugulosa BPL654]